MTDEQFNHLSQKLASVYEKLDRVETTLYVHAATHCAGALSIQAQLFQSRGHDDLCETALKKAGELDKVAEKLLKDLE